MRLRHEAAARRQAQQRVAFPIRLFHRVVVVSGVVGRGQEEALRNCGVKEVGVLLLYSLVCMLRVSVGLFAVQLASKSIVMAIYIGGWPLENGQI